MSGITCQLGECLQKGAGRTRRKKEKQIVLSPQYLEERPEKANMPDA